MTTAEFIVVAVLALICALLSGLCLWLDKKRIETELALEEVEEALEFWSKEEDVDGRAV